MSLKVLVVDDDAQIRKLLIFMLRSSGYEVTEAADGFEALALATTIDPDAVLLDLMMPNMDGFETCRRLRGLPGMAKVPIIILSAKDQVSDKVEGFKVGATDYVTKPVERAELLARLEAHIRAVEAAAPKPSIEKEIARLVVVAGIKGGVGATSVAINLAFGLQRESGEKVILVDSDLPYGDAALGLNLVAHHGMSSLAQYGDDLDQEVVEQALANHFSGLRVLAAAGTGINVDHAVPDTALKVIPFLRQSADFVVVDTPPLIDYPLAELVQQCSRLLLVLTPDIGTLRRTSVALNWLDTLNIKPDKVQLVLNRMGSGDIPLDQAERHLGRPVHLKLDEDSRVRLSFNRGIPLLQDNPRSQPAKVLQQTVRSLQNLAKPVITI